MADAGVLSQETIYQHLYAEAWEALLGLIHQHAAWVSADALAAQAIRLAIDTLFRRLAADPNAITSEVLEKLLLLHRGGFYQLSDEQMEQAVVLLVERHTEQPEVAVSYARFWPEHPTCAAVLAAYAAPVVEPIAHSQADHVSVTQTGEMGATSHTISLFRSQQERVFFMAVREVFPAYLVYPNVALNSIVEYEAIQPHLSAAERSYFFRALVDCVVFDQHDDYRPRFCFELDSPLHEDAQRQTKDRYKDRILALAGQPLHRIRAHMSPPERSTFVRLLKEIAQQGLS